MSADRGLQALQMKRTAAKTVINLIGLKSIYQVMYLIFALIVMKNLNVVEYGIYSYILSMIMYFSSIPLLGLPLYLQKSAVRNDVINLRYISVAIGSICLGLVIAWKLLPDLNSSLKISVIMIITYNILITTLVAINDGLGKYSYQYLYLLLASLWMAICIVQATVLHFTLDIQTILRYWEINSIIVFFIAFINLWYISTHALKFNNRPNKSYLHLFMDLLLIYSVSIPDGFAKFYDKYLANTYLEGDFLGKYSFNLMVVATVYAFLIRPINSIFITQLAKEKDNMHLCNQIIKNYYIFSLVIYSMIYIIYVTYFKEILNFVGLERYQDTVCLFKICFLNTILYILSYPFITLLAISNAERNKFIYCILSILIFNMPLLLLIYHSNSSNFLAGFLLSYSLNFLLILLFQYKYAIAFAKTLLTEIKTLTQGLIIRLTP